MMVQSKNQHELQWVNLFISHQKASFLSR